MYEYFCQIGTTAEEDMNVSNSTIGQARNLCVCAIPATSGKLDMEQTPEYLFHSICIAE